MAAAPTAAPSIPPPPLAEPEARGERYALRLVDRLGAEREVEVRQVDQDDAVLGAIAGSAPEGLAFALEVAEGSYLVVPLASFRRAWGSGDAHAVTLASGAEVRGRLRGVVEASGADLKYDLSWIRTLQLARVPRRSAGAVPSPRPPEEATVALLELRGAAGPGFELREPRFWFRYASGAGYLVGSATHTVESASFRLGTGGKEVLANLSDFPEVAFGRSPVRESGSAPEFTVRVTAPSGVQTAGVLVLRQRDSEGDHAGRDWWLAGRPGRDGTFHAFRSPVGTLRRR